MTYLITSGLSYLIIILFQLGKTDDFLNYLPTLMVLISFPHFMVTYWVWGKRVSNWKNELGGLFFPAIYSIGFFFLHKLNNDFFSVSLLLKASYLYLLYHFGQQLYGVTLWTGYKNNVNFNILKKRMLRFLLILTSIYAWLEMETRQVLNVLFYHPVEPWSIPSAYVVSCFYLVLIFSGLTILWIFWDFFKTKSTKSFFLLAPLGLSWIWFLPPFNQKLILYLPILHALQYFPFIWMKLRSLTALRKLTVFVVSVLSGWFLFRFVPFHFSPIEGTLWPALVLSCLNNHHFIIDGRIWKLSDPLNQDLRAN